MTVIHPENSMDGWDSGISEEIKLQKKAEARQTLVDLAFQAKEI